MTALSSLAARFPRHRLREDWRGWILVESAFPEELAAIRAAAPDREVAMAFSCETRRPSRAAWDWEEARSRRGTVGG